MVGEGVNEFKNLTSESQEGRRLFNTVVAFEEMVEPKLEDIAGKKSVEKAFLMSLSNRGSPEEKSNIDWTGRIGDCPSVPVELVADVALVVTLCP
jgi:hypothetical protein